MKSNKEVLDQIEQVTEALKGWKEELVLGGGVALIVYDECMAKTNAKPVGTTDMDFLIPRAPVISAKKEFISKSLMDLGFKHRPKNTDTPPIESYVKDEGSVEFEVEFLTDDRAKEKSQTVSIPGTGVVAQTLSYLEMSLESVTQVALPSGRKIKVVTPEAWAFHKGLTFTRRKPGSQKQFKDLYGLWFVLTQLKDLSELALTRLKDLQKAKHANWTTTFNSNLNAWCEDATPKDWERLSQQDPEGRLTEAVFRSLISKLQTPALSTK